jgi:hypothetical protein
MKSVVYNYLMIGFYVLIEFTCAWALVTFGLGKYRVWVADQMRLRLFLLGTGLLLVAGIGRLGWPIQSIGGSSPAEKLDQAIFLALSLFGTFLLLLDFFLSRSK